MTLKRYTLKVTEPQYWQEIHDLLCVASSCEHIPDREVSCVDEKEHSSTRGTFELEDSEAEALQNHPHIEWIELDPTAYPELYRQPTFASKRWKKDVKVYRGLDNILVSPITTNPTAAELDRTNWAIVRTGVTSCGQFSGWENTAAGENVPAYNATVDYSLSGANVDIVIQDSGVLQYHPEFMDGNGQSRVRDIVLDGPFYIDPDYFIANGYTYTKPDGRTGITTASAEAWWENVADRSPKFASIGTVAIPTGYTENNAIGNSLSGTNNINDGHGTACAALAAGKNFGHAFQANIWNIAVIAANTGLGVEASYDLIKLFHTHKPINSSTGVKNPTIVNGSWAYSITLNPSSTYNYQFRGTTGTFVGNAPTTNQFTAMKNGLVSLSWTAESGSSSTDTAGDELIDSGVIFAAAAGNENQRLGSGPNDVDRDNWMIAVNGGHCNHKDWLNPIGNGWRSSEPDYYPVICVGALDDFIDHFDFTTSLWSNHSERKAFYSNNGPGIDVWAPADETISAGLTGDGAYEDFVRYDDTSFYDCRFNGTSAAAPVCVGLVSLYLETNPTATSREVKTWLRDRGTVELPEELLWDVYDNDTTTEYWTYTYNLRGSSRRVLYNPYASGIVPSLGPEE